MTEQHSIKRGVSLYSFQEEYFLRKMNLEDMLATLARLGIPGVEIIGDQMIPNYPNISAAFYDQWHAWMEKYHLAPTCLDMFLDWNKYKGRVMTDDEKVQSVQNDILCANRLGCTVIRVITHTQPEILERLAPFAEKNNVRLGVEIHSPFHFDHEYEQSLLAMYRRVQSPYLGFVPDMGIYVKRFPRVISERWVRDGANPEIVRYIVEAFNHHALEHIDEAVKKMGATPEDVGRAIGATRFIYTDPRRMLDFMPYIFHIHAKFYEMLPEYKEYSIPYEEIVPVLIEGGYSGYLSSEYEGNRHIQDVFEVDSTEQVRRQQVMFRHLLGES
ncbi:MAG TPA: TIM barrel protein [Anaerolineales bacterium]|nr:TIM barrel protein [Anaerolineales bacterium]